MWSVEKAVSESATDNCADCYCKHKITSKGLRQWSLVATNKPANDQISNIEASQVGEAVPTDSEIFRELDRERAERMKVRLHGRMVAQRRLPRKQRG